MSWISENPSRVMTSSTEAECRGLVHFSKENLWHRQFQKELALFEIDSPTIVFEDNTSAITMASDLGTPQTIKTFRNRVCLFQAISRTQGN